MLKSHIDAFEAKMAAEYAVPEVGSYAVQSETGQFLRSFIRLTHPSLVVELGTCQGISTLWMAAALEELGEGELYSFDVFEVSDPDVVRARIESFGFGRRVRMFVAPSSTAATKILADLGRPVDFAFIDADHRIEGVAADVTALWPHVNTGGFIALHDTNPESSGWDGPRYVLDLIERSGIERQSSAVLDLPTGEGWGLAIIQKRVDPGPKLLPSVVYFMHQLKSRLGFRVKGRSVREVVADDGDADK